MAQQTTNAAADEMRTICSSLKQLESEAAYKLQVSATDGPASAILHFTTQTNGISGFFFLLFFAHVGCQSAMISPDGPRHSAAGAFF